MWSKDGTFLWLRSTKENWIVYNNQSRKNARNIRCTTFSSAPNIFIIFNALLFCTNVETKYQNFSIGMKNTIRKTNLANRKYLYIVRIQHILFFCIGHSDNAFDMLLTNWKWMICRNVHIGQPSKNCNGISKRS